MAEKLDLKQYPAGHGPDDFQCFGPAATQDDKFEGTKIADLACFAQRDGEDAKAAGKAADSNKYYHGSVVQSKKDKSWYAYFEWGRVGQKASFQFYPAGSASEAEKIYVTQLKSKNVKRGKWEQHKVLGQRLVPKSEKEDLYIVSPMATRSTGLPDAKTITCDDGIDQKKLAASKKPDAPKAAKPKIDLDRQTLSLMRDLNVATVKYAKASMADAALPTQGAIDKGRLILEEALKCVARIGDKIDEQVEDKELKQLTRDMYGLVPKKKDRGAAPETWILSANNILSWKQDLDAFESALYVADLGEIETTNPLGDIPAKIEWLAPTSDLGKFIHEWMPKATRNVHGGVGGMKIKNVWKVDRHGDDAKLEKHQRSIGKFTTEERPLHQPKVRIDLTRDQQKLFVESGTHFFFHGTRSVNVSGILRESLRLPRQLVGVVITGAMFGGGCYWADDWKKSAGYTSLRGSYWSSGDGGVANRGAFMFVTDVCIGKPFVAPGPRGYTGPPSGYNSVFGKGNFKQFGSSQSSGVANNEFITYERESHRLRYLVEFDT